MRSRKPAALLSNGFDAPADSSVPAPHDAFAYACDYPAGVVLFRQGDPSGHVFHLEHGLVKLLRLEDNGDEHIVGLRGCGWFLGAAAAILHEPYAATGMTVVPSRVSRIGASDFRDLLAHNTALSWRLHEAHSREVYAELAQVADLMSISARERLLQLLRRLAPELSRARPAGEVRFELPLRQWEIAQLIGVTPPYLCQLMAELEHDGAVQRDRRSIVLHPRRDGVVGDRPPSRRLVARPVAHAEARRRNP